MDNHQSKVGFVLIALFLVIFLTACGYMGKVAIIYLASLDFVYLSPNQISLLLCFLYLAFFAIPNNRKK